MTYKASDESMKKGGISDGDLLRANATVIAGTLIFLTISSLTLGSGTNLTFLTGLILVPFCVSSLPRASAALIV